MDYTEIEYREAQADQRARQAREVAPGLYRSNTSSSIFASGAKSSERKPRYDLIPSIALEREAVRMAEGAAAHGENNYQQGVGDEAFRRDRINHMIEHALKYAQGDRSTDHLAGVRCNAAMLMWLDKARAEKEFAER